MSSTYIKHGFLHDVYEPWIVMISDEWSRAVGGLLTAYDETDVWNEEELDWLENTIFSQIDMLWHDGHYHNYADDVPKEAWKEYESASKYWRERADSFGQLAAFEAVEALIPEWMKRNPEPQTPMHWSEFF